MTKFRASLKIGGAFFAILVLGVFIQKVTAKFKKDLHFGKNEALFAFTKTEIAQAVGSLSPHFQFPARAEVRLNEQQTVQADVQYSFDAHLQKSMSDLFDTYDPDYGAFVAMDAMTGRVLSMISYSNFGKASDNLALRASFPSASVFKVVTAAAAIEEHKISGKTVIPFNGRRHTLYRGQILSSAITRWTRFITLKEAFAHSINTVFGKIGAFTVGPQGLREYANRFGFNHSISSDVSIQEGRALIPDDSWGVAESASGYTRDNTMSPLQGALIAAAIANDGVMMEPYVVEAVTQRDGRVLYAAKPKISTVVVEPSTAMEIRSLMKETVLHGTSRGSFRGFFRKNFTFLDVGGKTGSLTGYDPRGKYDWFVGYADSGSQKIALAALTIHEKKWKVKSSYLARRAIENYFRDTFASNKAVAQR